jgi:hypothetical protein
VVLLSDVREIEVADLVSVVEGDEQPAVADGDVSRHSKAPGESQNAKKSPASERGTHVHESIFGSIDGRVQYRLPNLSRGFQARGTANRLSNQPAMLHYMVGDTTLKWPENRQLSFVALPAFPGFSATEAHRNRTVNSVAKRPEHATVSGVESISGGMARERPTSPEKIFAKISLHRCDPAEYTCEWKRECPKGIGPNTNRVR